MQTCLMAFLQPQCGTGRATHATGVPRSLLSSHQCLHEHMKEQGFNFTQKPVKVQRDIVSFK